MFCMDVQLLKEFLTDIICRIGRNMKFQNLLGLERNKLKKQYTSVNKDKDLKQVMKDWESTISDGSYDW